MGVGHENETYNMSNPSRKDKVKEDKDLNMYVSCKSQLNLQFLCPRSQSDRLRF